MSAEKSALTTRVKFIGVFGTSAGTYLYLEKKGYKSTGGKIFLSVCAGACTGLVLGASGL